MCVLGGVGISRQVSVCVGGGGGDLIENGAGGGGGGK